MAKEIITSGIKSIIKIIEKIKAAAKEKAKNIIRALEDFFHSSENKLYAKKIDLNKLLLLKIISLKAKIWIKAARKKKGINIAAAKIERGIRGSHAFCE